MADMVRKEIRKCFEKEQISFVLRYALNGMIHEEFVGMKPATL